VRTGEDTAVRQAIFERGVATRAAPDDQRGASREIISPAARSPRRGRSRAFIDDTLATTAALKELGNELIELHGQHEHQALLNLNRMGRYSTNA
jgi:DNA repair protein RecN (Recombination protein N)